MHLTDRILDATLLGYTRLGSSMRRVDVGEPFPEVGGKHVMVTGATGGIGRSIALRLASNGAMVHAVGRSEAKLVRLQDEVGERLSPHLADLSLMADVAELGRTLVATGTPLQVLVNNVSVMAHDRTTTDEGWELTYATNVLGPFVLTRHLLPVLEESAPSRIVFVSSGGMYTQPLTTFDTDNERRDHNGTTEYARTKRAQVVLAEELAKSASGHRVTVNSMHPGWVDTAGVRQGLPTFRKIMGPLLRTEAEGADTAVWLAASDTAAHETGGFFHDRVRRRTYRTRGSHETAGVREDFMRELVDNAAPYLDQSDDQEFQDSSNDDRNET